LGDKDITGFEFPTVGRGVKVKIDQASRNILVVVPTGVNRNGLVPDVFHTGVSLNPPTRTPQNFTGIVFYTVTADNATTKTYSVTVINEEQRDFEFSFTGPAEENIEGVFPDSPQSGTITISITTSYDTISWRVKGLPRGDLDDLSTINLNALDFTLGEHSVTAIVSKDGSYYSKRLTFTVIREF
jgi:hypothetical protein